MDLNKLKKTFSLKSLLIVFFCLSLLIVVTIPWFMKAKLKNNEGRAIGTLRVLSMSQAQFQSQAQVDQDEDGAGEYGLLGELAGIKSRRGNSTGPNGWPVVNPPFITPVLAPKNGASFGAKSGYNFQVYLPGRPTTDNGTVAALPFLTQTIIIDCQEIYLRIYAWPQEFNSSGIKCFAVDQAAEIVSAPNRKGFGSIYSGAKKIPSFDAAVYAKDNDSSNQFEGIFRSDLITKDGQKWKAVND